jgi:hypothetical protein
VYLLISWYQSSAPEEKISFGGEFLFAAEILPDFSGWATG